KPAAGGLMSVECIIARQKVALNLRLWERLMENASGCSGLLAIRLHFLPRWACVAATIGLMAAFTPASAFAQAPCPSPVPTAVPPPNLTAPEATLVPGDVCIPAFVPGGLPIDYFDNYSWRAFIAFAWPALSGQRGVPDRNQPITATDRPLVFETYKADWETFQPGGVPPSEFNSNASFWTSNPTQSPCPQAKPGDFLLAPVSKFRNVGLAG